MKSANPSFLKREQCTICACNPIFFYISL